MCAIRYDRQISSDVAIKIYVGLSCSSGFLAAVLEDAIGKVFYFIVSIGVIYVFAIAPGMATADVTVAGNATGMGNGTQFSNSSMSGPTSIQHLESWSSRESAQNLALLIVPSVCAVRVAWCRGLAFFFQDVRRLLTGPLDQYTDLDELNEK